MKEGEVGKKLKCSSEQVLQGHQEDQGVSAAEKLIGWHWLLGEGVWREFGRSFLSYCKHVWDCSFNYSIYIKPL